VGRANRRTVVSCPKTEEEGGESDMPVETFHDSILDGDEAEAVLAAFEEEDE
jgi:hypothetical protein